jgi:hypothetical protein
MIHRIMVPHVLSLKKQFSSALGLAETNTCMQKLTYNFNIGMGWNFGPTEKHLGCWVQKNVSCTGYLVILRVLE